MEEHIYTSTPELGESLLALGEHLAKTFGDWNNPNPALAVLIDTIGGEEARKIWWAGQRVLKAQKRVRQAIDEKDINPLLNSTDVETVEEYERRKSRLHSEAQKVAILQQSLEEIAEGHQDCDPIEVAQETLEAFAEVKS